MKRRLALALASALVLAAVALTALPFVHQWHTARETARAQTELRAQLLAGEASTVRAADRVNSASSPPIAVPTETGRPLAELTIPRFGASWSWIVVEGTSADDLEKGPGHYPETPLPGAPGNVVLAAHRAGHGDPFLEFENLRAGDRIELTQGATTWTYALTTAPRIIPVTADWVLGPLPGRQLTLTTCWPKYGSSKRMYVRGELVTVSGR